jgi:6-phosphogluconolactonase
MRALGNFIALDNQSDWINTICRLISKKIRTSLLSKEYFYLAISGGNTPKVIFENLIENDNLTNAEWKRVCIFWVDERIVPHHSNESNFGNAMTFLKKIPATFFPLYDEQIGIEESINQFVLKLKDLPSENSIPVFDLILLGMGDDGHTASLFNGSKGLHEKEKWVCQNHIPSLDAHRVTMTFPLINNSNEVYILINGSKLKLLSEIVAHKTEYPIENIFVDHLSKTWIYY